MTKKSKSDTKPQRIRAKYYVEHRAQNGERQVLSPRFSTPDDAWAFVDYIVSTSAFDTTENYVVYRCQELP